MKNMGIKILALTLVIMVIGISSAHADQSWCEDHASTISNGDVSLFEDAMITYIAFYYEDPVDVDFVYGNFGEGSVQVKAYPISDQDMDTQENRRNTGFQTGVMNPMCRCLADLAGLKCFGAWP